MKSKLFFLLGFLTLALFDVALLHHDASLSTGEKQILWGLSLLAILGMSYAGEQLRIHNNK